MQVITEGELKSKAQEMANNSGITFCLVRFKPEPSNPAGLFIVRDYAVSNDMIVVSVHKGVASCQH